MEERNYDITLLLDGGADTIGLMADFDSVAIIAPAPMQASVLEEIPAMEEMPVAENPVTEEQQLGGPLGGETLTEPGVQEPQPDFKL